MSCDLRDDPRHPREGMNKVPMYCAIWSKTIVLDGEQVQKNIGSGWRTDLADVSTLADRMGGHVIRGYFGGMI